MQALPKPLTISSDSSGWRRDRRHKLEVAANSGDGGQEQEQEVHVHERRPEGLLDEDVVAFP